MPAITLGFYNMTLIMRLVRAEMLEALRSDLHPLWRHAAGMSKACTSAMRCATR